MSSEEANRIAKAAASVRRRSRASLKVMLPTAAALGAGAAVAIGAIPGSDGVITGCYQTVPQANDGNYPYGTLRVIDPNAPRTDSTGAPTPTEVYQCSGQEGTITWNQQGPPGQQGTPGSQGAPGSKGANGAPGENGSILGNTTFSIQAAGKTHLFLKLDGISGESTAKDHKDSIGLSTFAAGAETPVIKPTGSGAGAGKVQVQTFEFIKSVDKTSPTLFRDLSNGHVFKTAVIDVVSGGSKKSIEVGTYKLADVVIKNVADKGKTEQVTGVFKSLESTIGSGQAKVNTGWNKVSNSGWDLTASKGS
jgi:type VI secretion system secreted protein Hcp